VISVRYNAVKTYFWQAPESSFGGVRFAVSRRLFASEGPVTPKA